MKKHLIQLLIILSIGCNAQTPIISMNDFDYGSVENAYYKDLENFLDQFEGTWLYTNGNTSLKIVLQKKGMFYSQFGLKKYFADFIVGEYQYIENSTEKVNTLSNLLFIHNNIINYNINGNIQKNNETYPKCPECTINFERLLVDFNEPTRRNVTGLDARMVFRKFVENGITKLKVWFYMVSPSYGHLDDETPTNIETYSIPFGEYILIKQ
jgi:hypothetical protein